MKKFVEPELRRIELKLTENIAASLEEKHGYYAFFRTRQYVVECTEFIMETNVNPHTMTREEFVNNSGWIYDTCQPIESYSVVASYYGL